MAKTKATPTLIHALGPEQAEEQGRHTHRPLCGGVPVPSEHIDRSERRLTCPGCKGHAVRALRALRQRGRDLMFQTSRTEGKMNEEMTAFLGALDAVLGAFGKTLIGLHQDHARKYVHGQVPDPFKE